jgi:hypothetical protein
MRALVLCLALFFPWLSPAQLCPRAQQAATSALALRQTLRAVSVRDGYDDIAPEIRPNIHDFKQALIATVEARLGCDSHASEHPAGLQSALADLLNANLPAKPDPKDAPVDPPSTETDLYGAELKVALATVPHHSDLISIQLTYDIPCGVDNILLLYRETPSGWQRALLWQNPDLNSIGDALGDIFLFTLVPGPTPSIAVTYGSPWCSSNLSMLHVDLIALSTPTTPQHLLDHLDHDYRRDYDVHLHAEDDGFELLAEVESMDESRLMRPGILRYATTSGKLIQRQPVANDAVGFVDGWYGASWVQASAWSAPEARASLKQAYIRQRDNDATKKKYESIDFGPVRGCSRDPLDFQVEMDRTLFITKVGSEDVTWHDIAPLYAKVRQNPNSFTMLSITQHPDPACNGPDLMKPSKP